MTSDKLKVSQSSSVSVFKSVITVFIVSVTSAVTAVAGNFMNLNFIMTVISGKFLSILEVRDICNK